MSLRFTPDAAAELRRAVAEAGGVEVFAIGDVEGKRVVAVTIACRGLPDRVPALLERPRTGQVVIHNHPSGNLQPSDPDMQLAGIYGDDGVGVVIVDSEVTRDNWVVEPHAKREAAVDPAAIEAFFRDQLPRVLKDYEPRDQQIQMALDAGRALSEGHPLLVEAGTGTGKSLAYLVPAALWALANDAKVVVSTHTKALQGQLLASDLPLLARAGLEVRSAVLQGRGNYACKRRLALADEEDRGLPADERAELDAILQWERTSADGSRSDLPFHVDGALWERVQSDTDLTLRVRCPHYAECRFYGARRGAAAAHLVVVNHALLLADLAIKDSGAPAGVLPRFQRLVLDEAHHLEEAATGAVASKVTGIGLARAVAPLLTTKRRRGALDRLLERCDRPDGPLPAHLRDRLPHAVAVADVSARSALDHGRSALRLLSADAVAEDGTPTRVTAETERASLWEDLVRPRVELLASEIEVATGALDALSALFTDVVLPEADAQPLLDVQRAMRRLSGHAETARAFLEHSEEVCRWIERAGRRGADHPEAALNAAPIEVGPTLRRMLWGAYPGVVATSATLTVGGRFGFWARRAGAWSNGEEPPPTSILPSPFDHERQALLALPRDLPEPEDADFLRASGEIVVDAVRLADGGAFVLCTSYRATEHYGALLRDALPHEQPVLVQGQASRGALLDRFRQNRRAVLVGTDSFWEGVSVKGEGLRLVVIPRLPFRVPTDPLLEARHERIALRGGDPFRQFSLPQTVIKLRQGYGRLIRHRDDRGVVLLLDRRVHERSYGALVLGSLPPARRAVGPWQRVRDDVAAFFAGAQPTERRRQDVAAFLEHLRGR